MYILFLKLKDSKLSIKDYLLLYFVKKKNIFFLKLFYEASCISMSVFFPTYELFKNKFSKNFNVSKEHPFSIIPSVIGSWTISSIFTSPISLIKVRLQTKKYNESGLIKTTKRVIQEEGLRGLYKGYKGTLLFATQFSIYFCIYEPLKLKYQDFRLIPLISGISTILSVLICYPNDFIVSRIMYQGKDVVYNGFFDAYKQTIKKEGFLSLYTGLSTSMSRFVIGSIITFSTYEMMKNLFKF